MNERCKPLRRRRFAIGREAWPVGEDGVLPTDSRTGPEVIA